MTREASEIVERLYCHPWSKMFDPEKHIPIALTKKEIEYAYQQRRLLRRQALDPRP